MQNLLWLPSNYRATCLAIRSNIFVLEHTSGRVTFIEFSLSRNEGKMMLNSAISKLESGWTKYFIGS